MNVEALINELPDTAAEAEGKKTLRKILENMKAEQLVKIPDYKLKRDVSSDTW